MRVRNRWFVVAILTSIPFVTSSGATPLYSTVASVLKGPEALQFLAGKTLRSIRNSKSGPTYRYYVNDHLEYRCLGVDLTGVGRSNPRVYGETEGCAVLTLSMKEQRLCETDAYEECAKHQFAFTFRKVAGPTIVSGHHLLGRIKLKYADPTPAGSNFENPAEYDLFEGNATIFPNFDPTSRPDLLESVEPKDLDDEERRCLEGAPPRGNELISKIVGNTLVWRDRGGKFDGRRAEYFGQDGLVTSIVIPERPLPSNSPVMPLESGGGISINRWKIEKGLLCRTENDYPTRYVCGGLVRLQKPKSPSDASQSRWCVSASQTETKYIIDGNPYRIGFTVPGAK